MRKHLDENIVSVNCLLTFVGQVAKADVLHCAVRERGLEDPKF